MVYPSENNDCVTSQDEASNLLPIVFLDRRRPNCQLEDAAITISLGEQGRNSFVKKALAKSFPWNDAEWSESHGHLRTIYLMSDLIQP